MSDLSIGDRFRGMVPGGAERLPPTGRKTKRTASASGSKGWKESTRTSVKRAAIWPKRAKLRRTR
jgi:hypothetical protein